MATRLMGGSLCKLYKCLITILHAWNEYNYCKANIIFFLKKKKREKKDGHSDGTAARCLSDAAEGFQTHGSRKKPIDESVNKCRVERTGGEMSIITEFAFSALKSQRLAKCLFEAA